MHERDVFINCPFSADYKEYFEAIVFAVVRSGFAARCARENDDGAEVRIDKICRIISESRYSIHDISKTELDPGSNLPRFNMPLELGLFLGARKFGGGANKRKKTLIFDREQHRYQTFMSDIAGQDIHSHGGDVTQMIEQIAAWLRDEVGDPRVPGGQAIAVEFKRFRADLPDIAASKQLQVEELTFRDLSLLAAEWIFAAAI